jgi:hypothetical protein
MLVPDLVRQCVLFLGSKDDKSGHFIPRATAFVVTIEEANLGFRYVVTAAHAIEGFHKHGLELFIRSNLANGGVREDSWGSARWFLHPGPEPTDIAVASIDFLPEEEFQAIVLRSDFPGKDICATPQAMQAYNFGLGDEVFIVGLFRSHYGRQRNVPIIRVGNLAMMRGEPVETQYGATDAYLVEARSIGGLSGSPVFVHHPVLNPQGATRYWLLGLMHGHFDIKNLNEDTVVDSLGCVTTGINTGVGVVIPVERILETLDQPELVAKRQKDAAEFHRGKIEM